MLEELKVRQVRRIAKLASSAREARDALLHGGGALASEPPHPAKGETDRTGGSDYDVAAADSSGLRALRHAIAGLRSGARQELFALMRIGQGELAAADWSEGLSEAAVLGDENIRGILAEDIDLSSHLGKGLYELRAPAP